MHNNKVRIVKDETGCSGWVARKCLRHGNGNVVDAIHYWLSHYA